MAQMTGRSWLARVSTWLLCGVAGCSPVRATGFGGDAVPLRDAMPGGALPAALREVRDPLPALARPAILGAVAVSVSDLPILEPAPVSAAPLRALQLDGGTPRVNGYVLRVDDGHKVAFSDRPSSSLQRCSHVLGSSRLRWEGVAVAGWTPDALDYEVYEGSASGCSASAKRASRVRARAVVPSLLYAFRSCEGPCSSPASSQQLHLVGPGARWLTHSAPDLAEQTRSHIGLFSHATVPFGPGQTSSLAITVDYASLHEFVARHRPVPEWTEAGERLLAASRFAQVQLDVVWMTAESEPSGWVSLLGDGPKVAQFLGSRGVQVP